MSTPSKNCRSCHREFSVFIRPYSCELCNENKLCSNCARKFVLSYEPNPSYLRLCNKCCDKVSKGNQLKNSSSKLSKNKVKNNSVWSFASSLIGRSSSASSPSPKSLKQSQIQSINLSSTSPPTSCTYCCSTQNKLINNKQFAEYTNPLKDQAPLFPENYNLSTPKRKEKRNIIFQHQQINNNTFNIQKNNDDNNDDDDDNYYLTMHPLNNLKMKPPKSILSVSMNKVALNISINKGQTQHYIGNLDKTSLCDCFSYIVKQKHIAQSTSDDNNNNNNNKAMIETEDQNAESGNEEIIDDKQNYDEYDDDINSFCHCITIPIKHKTFKLLRIDLLFDDKEYDQLMVENNNNDNNTEKYILINVLLYDHQSQIWSGVQMVKIDHINSFRIISKISVRCSQTLIKKSVNIIGSMSWKILNDATEETFDNNFINYPYKTCTISKMISILTQQRYDIIDSYETVIQQRNSAKNKNNQNSKRNSLESLRKNQIHPKEEKEDKNEAKQEEKKELKLLYPSGDISEEDGGSNIPTKRNELLSNKNADSLPNDEENMYGDNKNAECENALLSATCSSKHPGIKVEEMEKNMLQQEIARIDSMILGFEHAISQINDNENTKNNSNEFEEITPSMTSSFMFNTNELNNVKLQIAEHLNKNNKDDSNLSLSQQQLITNKKNENESNNVVCNVQLPTIPICVSCQRCSRTILLYQTNK